MSVVRAERLRAARQVAHGARTCWVAGEPEVATQLAIRALRILEPSSVPPHDFATALDRYRDAERALAVALRSPADRRRRRTGLALLALVFVMVGVGWTLRPPPPIRSSASGSLLDSDYFGAPRAIDGDVDTFWSLPDDTAGWLELRYAPPRDAKEVIVLAPADGHRGLFRARVRAVRTDGEELEAVLPIGADGRGRLELAQPAVIRVLRIEVERWRGQSGAISEVQLR